MLELRIKVPKSRKYEDYKNILIDSLKEDPAYKDSEVIIRDDRKEFGEVLLLIGFNGTSPLNTTIKCAVESTIVKKPLVPVDPVPKTSTLKKKK